MDQRAAKKMELLREQHNTGVKNLIRRLFSANNSGSCCVRTQSFWAQQFGYVWGAPSGRFDQPDPWKEDFHVLPRGAGRSTCFGLAPGIGCLQAAVPSIIHYTYYTTIQVGHGGIFQIHGHFGQSCPMTRYCVIEVVNKPYTRLQTPELQARLGTGQPGNAAANHLKPFRNTR